MYSEANRTENLSVLMKLVSNESSIEIESTLLFKNWVTNPKTLGDIAIIQIYVIIQRRIRNIIFDECTNKVPSPAMIDIKENTIKSLLELNFIQEIMNLLSSSSSTKKDTSILIFVALSNCKDFLKLLSYKNFIDRMIQHLNTMKQTQYVNYKEHIIATLSILRSIYIKDISLRRIFIELNGASILKEFLYCGDYEIVEETIYNIEDLICGDQEDNVGTTSSLGSIAIEEMIKELQKINIEEALFSIEKKNYGIEEENELKEDVNKLILLLSDKGDK